VYSRYADDLVFSTQQEAGSAHRLIRGINSVIRDEGFVVNEKKTQVMRAPQPPSRDRPTGK